MNSALQCLFSIPTIRKGVLAYPVDEVQLEQLAKTGVVDHTVKTVDIEVLMKCFES